jgi:hypothetical protein
MQKAQPWIYFVLALALLNCSQKPQGNTASTLSGDVAKLAEQFEADSAKARLLLLLSPT